MKLLVLSNGHGEDLIAVRIIEQLQTIIPQLQIKALPIVGTGYVYTQLGISIIGDVRTMPSGGFIYLDRHRFWEDVQGGLISLTLKQFKTVREWGKSGGAILAVGDIVPLLFAWLSRSKYAFVGTAKSEYYLRDNEGQWLSQTSWLERKLGSVYLPWERWLMNRDLCQGVFPRDTLTTDILKQFGVAAWDLGNPMMDGFSAVSEVGEGLSILLLPGSRMPEALGNWQQIMIAVSEVMAQFPNEKLLFLAAIAPAFNSRAFQEQLSDSGWELIITDSLFDAIADNYKSIWQKQNATLCLTQNAYQQCLQEANFAIAMAGTATEQFVGMGKPVVTIPGNGPQFTYAFAEAQTRLLGCSVTLVSHPEAVVSAIASLRNNYQKLKAISINGKKRMGTFGAAKRIALQLVEKLDLKS